MKRMLYTFTFSLLLNIFLGFMLFDQWKLNNTITNQAFNNFYHHLNTTGIYLDKYLDEKDPSLLAGAQKSADAVMMEANIISSHFDNHNSLSTYMNDFMGKIMTIEANDFNYEQINQYLLGINSLRETILPPDKKIIQKDKGTLNEFLEKAGSIVQIND